MCKKYLAKVPQTSCFILSQKKPSKMCKAAWAMSRLFLNHLHRTFPNSLVCLPHRFKPQKDQNQNSARFNQSQQTQ